LRVAHNGRLAGCSGGRVDTAQLCLRYGEHVERVVVAQILLDGKGEFAQVLERLQFVRVNAGRVERSLVMRYILIGMCKRPFHTLELDAGDLVAAGDFDRVQAFA